jgi:hypothetical protein
MEELKQALDILDWIDLNCRYPRKEINIIRKYKKEVIPYLYHSLEEAKEYDEEEMSQHDLHFFALYLLAEFKDTNAFEKIISFLSIKEDKIYLLIGDTVTEHLGSILYSTYNGNLDLLLETIYNPNINEYVRIACITLLAKLYLDKSIDKETLQSYLKDFIYNQKMTDIIYSEICMIICACHFEEMLLDIKYLCDNDMIDFKVAGGYREYTSMMYNTIVYSGLRRIDKIDNLDELISNWGMFSDAR